MYRFYKILGLIISPLIIFLVYSCNKKITSSSKDATYKINNDPLPSLFQKLYPDFDSKKLNKNIYKLLQNDPELKALYDTDTCGLIFFNGAIKQNELVKVLDILSNVERHGLHPEIFRVDHIKKLAMDIDSGYIDNDSIYEKLITLDTLVTRSIMHYINGMNYGFLIPDSLFRKADYAINILRPDSAYLSQLYTDIKNDAVAAMYNSLPTDSVYQAMLQAYNYWKSKEENKLPEIKPKGPNLQYIYGDKSHNIRAIAKRLMWTGDFLPDSTYTDTLFQVMTKELMSAINSFRETISYPDDEKEVGALTITALNRDADYYLKKLAVNMERYRWKRMYSKNNKHIEVNIAAFKLFATQTDSVPLIMKICVGKTTHKTPLLQSSIAYLNLNPIWNVPKSIAKNEVIPLQKRDTSYLRKHNMRLYKGGKEVDWRTINWKKDHISEHIYYVRQDPGPSNSLGRIKFIFSNAFSVYLHDTPVQRAFARQNRAVSHGCVRVHRPVELAFFCTSPTTELYKDRLLYTIDRTPLTKEGKQLAAEESLKKLNDIITLGNKDKISLAIDYYTVYMHPGKDKLYYAYDVYGYDDIIYNALNTGRYNKIDNVKTEKDELY